MEWIFIAFLAASIIHMGEEYFLPGGFMDVMKNLNPKFAPFINAPSAIIINGLQLLLCVIVIMVGIKPIIFSMSIAGLLFFNGLMHIMACIRQKGYSPGVVSGVLLYIPLSVYAYYHFILSGQLMAEGMILTGLLGLIYQAVPIAYFALASWKSA